MIGCSFNINQINMVLHKQCTTRNVQHNESVTCMQHVVQKKCIKKRMSGERETSHLDSVGTHFHDCKVPLAVMDPA